MLIEAMVAMGVISISLLGVFALLSQSLELSRTTSNQYVGTYLAAEGIEVVKNIVDTNTYKGGAAWNAGLIQSGQSSYTFTVQYDSTAPESFSVDTPLLFDPSTGTYNYQTGNYTTFTRAVTVTSLLSGNELQVDSVVGWVNSGGIKDSVKLEDDLYNWR